MLTNTEKRSGTFKGDRRVTATQPVGKFGRGTLVAVAAAGLLAAAQAGAQARCPDARGVRAFHREERARWRRDDPARRDRAGDLGPQQRPLRGDEGQAAPPGYCFRRRPRRRPAPCMWRATRGGDELTVKLSRPRCNAARRTVGSSSDDWATAGPPKPRCPSGRSLAPVRPGVTRWSAPARAPSPFPSSKSPPRLHQHRPIQPDLLGHPLSFQQPGQRPPDCRCDLFRRVRAAIRLFGLCRGAGREHAEPPRIPPTPLHEPVQSRCHDHQRPGKRRRKRPARPLWRDLAPIWLRGRMTLG